MNKTPLAERLHIVLWGLRNVGKSSLMNNLFQAQISIVSPVPGTTTDTVTRAYELLPLGPVAVTDTPGLDDHGDLGKLRVKAALTKIQSAGLSVLVTRADQAFHPLEIQLLQEFTQKKIPLLIVKTHGDLPGHVDKNSYGNFSMVTVNNLRGTGVDELKNFLIRAGAQKQNELTPVEGVVQKQDLVVLVTPIDSAAPKGRLILPQVETIRDLLDRDCGVLVTKETDLEWFLSLLKTPPQLVICDSQAFAKTAEQLTEGQLLTSFSILFARKKSDFSFLVRSLGALGNMKPGSQILILEACNHHQQEDDIGTVKIPNLFRKIIQPQVSFTHLRKMPEKEALKDFDLIIACGACMVTRDSMVAALAAPQSLSIPMVNYGLFLAYVNGLLPRALEPFPLEYEIYQNLGLGDTSKRSSP